MFILCFLFLCTEDCIFVRLLMLSNKKMNKILAGAFLFFLATMMSYSQSTKIEKGDYISKTAGQNFKLRLLENNKYELAVFYGDYEIKNDTLIFKNTQNEDIFKLNYTLDASSKSEKIKVKVANVRYHYNLYLGTQEGSLQVNYQNILKLAKETDFENASDDVYFDINRSQYLYLVEENYKEKSKIYKYLLPKSVSEITIEYQPNIFGNTKLMGYSGQMEGELIVSDKGKSPLSFVMENKIDETSKSKVVAAEIKNESNWTYPGKAKLDEEYGEEVVDTAAVAIVPDFKLKIENSLSEALKATKSATTKYLVIYHDPKNKNAKNDFEEFVKDQSMNVGTNFYDKYDPQFDLYNYYLATNKDKKWLKNNKIEDAPGLVVVNADGIVLAKLSGKPNANGSIFYYYDSFYSKLKKVEALSGFNNVIKSKKVSDAALLKAFVKVSALEEAYPVDYAAAEAAVVAVPEEESKAVPAEETDLAATAVDSVAAYYEAPYKLTDIKTDKNRVQFYWNQLLKAHQNDTKPDMDLVAITSKEINGVGFYKQFFGEEKALDNADFEAIEYLLKHYDAILAEQTKPSPNGEDFSDYSVKKIDRTISDALAKNNNFQSVGEASRESQKKTIDVYKKLIGKSKDNIEAYKNYFYLLNSAAEKLNLGDMYVEEYDTFFTGLFDGKTNVIEKLDSLYNEKDDQNYQSWADFKNNFSNLSNEAAWYVVAKSKNAAHVKKAIKWSESSLIIERNNAYYLDTLAQLYYKNGEKEKAIKTQELAIKYADTTVEGATKSEMGDVLQRMKNGTY